MPCTYYTSQEEAMMARHEAGEKAAKVKKRLKKERDRVNDLTRLLCVACGLINTGDMMSEELNDWWENHQEYDRNRIAKEKRLAEEQKKKRAAKTKLTNLKKVAISKLSKEEREVLGV